MRIRNRIAGSLTRWLVRPYRRKRRPTRLVTVVVPMPDRTELTEDERTSLRHLSHYLPDHPKHLLVPQGSSWKLPGFVSHEFPRRFFGSAANHGKLLMSRAFYRAFEDSEFLFFYHLDSLVFSSRLDDWCHAGYDWIGAPWIRCADSPWVIRNRVGNGGCSLLRVSKALQVLTARYRSKPSTFWLDAFTCHAPKKLVRWVGAWEKRMPHIGPAARLMREWHEVDDPAQHNRNNDVFWSDHAALYEPTFRVAPLEAGLNFAFEVSPRTCMVMNGGTMPFGCHAWTRYDRTFWEPHLLAESDTQTDVVRKSD